MKKSDLSEYKNKNFIIDDVSPEVFSLILDFLYNNSIEVKLNVDKVVTVMESRDVTTDRIKSQVVGDSSGEEIKNQVKDNNGAGCGIGEIKVAESLGTGISGVSDIKLSGGGTNVDPVVPSTRLDSIVPSTVTDVVMSTGNADVGISTTVVDVGVPATSAKKIKIETKTENKIISELKTENKTSELKNENKTSELKTDNKTTENKDEKKVKDIVLELYSAAIKFGIPELLTKMKPIVEKYHEYT